MSTCPVRSRRGGKPCGKPSRIVTRSTVLTDPRTLVLCDGHCSVLAVMRCTRKPLLWWTALTGEELGTVKCTLRTLRHALALINRLGGVDAAASRLAAMEAGE